MENCKETIKFYNGLFLLLAVGFLFMFCMYVKEYSKHHEKDSYWSRKYDSLLNENKVDVSDTIRLQ
jgi:hypothetical protein